MPEKTDELSGLIVTAIVGGAFIPPLMGFVSDKTSPTVGFIVPLVTILYNRMDCTNQPQDYAGNEVMV